jgi:hypothetical protein
LGYELDEETVNGKIIKLVIPDYDFWNNSSDIHLPYLLSAYRAGNIKAQFDAGVKRSDRYSGMIQVFKIYHLIQKKDENYKVKEIEDLKRLHAKGKLMEHLKKVGPKKKKK